MKKKFLCLSNGSLSQIQMWLNQYNTNFGGVVVESSLAFNNGLWTIVISHNAEVPVVASYPEDDLPF